jgi:hypothetical protein
MIASWKQFVEAVYQMRQVQNHYFKTRDPEILLLAKQCEREVDTCIDGKLQEWSDARQPTLFEEVLRRRHGTV